MSTANLHNGAQDAPARVRPVPPLTRPPESPTESPLTVNVTPLSPRGRRVLGGLPQSPPPLTPETMEAIATRQTSNGTAPTSPHGGVTSLRDRPQPPPLQPLSPPPQRSLPPVPPTTDSHHLSHPFNSHSEAYNEDDSSHSGRTITPPLPNALVLEYRPRDTSNNVISSRLPAPPKRKAPTPAESADPKHHSLSSTDSSSDRSNSQRTLDVSNTDGLKSTKSAGNGGSLLGLFGKNGSGGGRSQSPSVGASDSPSSAIPSTGNAEHDKLRVHFKSLDDPEKQKLFSRSPVPFTFSSHRDRVGYEVYTSELSYNTCMHLLVEVFKTPLLAAVKAGHVQVKPDHVMAIFGQVESVLKTSDILLDEFEQRISKWERESGDDTRVLGDIFVRYGDVLKVYATYAASQQNSKLAQEACNSSKSYHAMLKLSQQYPACQARDLSSLLIMPIQRIPRYELLLRDFLKVTPAEHPDHQTITNALTKIKTVAENVDRSVEEYKEIDKLLEIQRCFAPGSEPLDLVVPGRRFIKEGSLIKVCRRANKTRKFWLFNDLLVYAIPILTGTCVVSGIFPLKGLLLQDLPDAQEEDTVNNSTMSTHQLHRLSMMPGSDFNLSNGSVSPHASIAPGTIAASPTQTSQSSPATARKAVFQFMIQTRSKSFVVFANSIQEKADWMVAIMTAAEKCTDAAKSIASKNGAVATDGKLDVAPAWVPDALAPRCKLCSVEFGIVTRRHHCRHCGDVVCDDCSKHRIILPGLDKNAVRVCNNCNLKLGYGGFGGAGSASSSGSSHHNHHKSAPAEQQPAPSTSPSAHHSGPTSPSMPATHTPVHPHPPYGGINLLAGLTPPPTRAEEQS